MISRPLSKLDSNRKEWSWELTVTKHYLTAFKDKSKDMHQVVVLLDFSQIAGG